MKSEVALKCRLPNFELHSPPQHWSSITENISLKAEFTLSSSSVKVGFKDITISILEKSRLLRFFEASLQLSGKYSMRRPQRPHGYLHIHCRAINIFISHDLLPSDLVAQSVEQRWSNPKVVGSIPTLVRVFLCPCVGPIPSVGLTLTWCMGRKLALHITL